MIFSLKKNVFSLNLVSCLQNMFKHIIKILKNNAKFMHKKYRKKSTLNFYVSHLTATRKHQVQ